MGELQSAVEKDLVGQPLEWLPGKGYAQDFSDYAGGRIQARTQMAGQFFGTPSHEGSHVIQNQDVQARRLSITLSQLICNFSTVSAALRPRALTSSRSL